MHACLIVEVWWLPSSSRAADARDIMQVTMYLDDGSPTPSYPVAGQEYMQLKLGDVVEVVLQNNAAWLNGNPSHSPILQPCAVAFVVPAEQGCLGWVQPGSTRPPLPRSELPGPETSAAHGHLCSLSLGNANALPKEGFLKGSSYDLGLCREHMIGYEDCRCYTGP